MGRLGLLSVEALGWLHVRVLLLAVWRPTLRIRLLAIRLLLRILRLPLILTRILLAGRIPRRLLAHNTLPRAARDSRALPPLQETRQTYRRRAQNMS